MYGLVPEKILRVFVPWRQIFLVPARPP